MPRRSASQMLPSVRSWLRRPHPDATVVGADVFVRLSFRKFQALVAPSITRLGPSEVIRATYDLQIARFRLLLEKRAPVPQNDRARAGPGAADHNRALERDRLLVHLSQLPGADRVGRIAAMIAAQVCNLVAVRACALRFGRSGARTGTTSLDIGGA
jgi:hypothetical protein